MQQTISRDFVLYLLGTIIALYYIFKLKERYFYLSHLIPTKLKTKSIAEGGSNTTDNRNILPLSSDENPGFFTVYSDGESSFIISIYKKIICKTGWQEHPIFAIHIHKKDEILLRRIQSYFGRVGKWVSLSSDSVVYTVNSIKDIINVIIPHFDKYPLLTKKCADYLLFKATVLLMKDKKHLTLDGLQEIVNIRASMNKDLSEDSLLAPKFKINPVIIPKVDWPKEINPNWIVGFVVLPPPLDRVGGGRGPAYHRGPPPAGWWGLFFIGITKNTKIKVNFNVNFIFKVSQHKRDIELLKMLSIQLNCGTIQDNSESVGIFQCKKLSDIETKIFPFFKNYPLQGVKLLEYEDFCKAFNLMLNKEHLTEEGLIKTREIKSVINYIRYKDNKSNILKKSFTFEFIICLRDLKILWKFWLA